MRAPVTPESVGPLSRPVEVAVLPPAGIEIAVQATPEERQALAADFRLPAIHELRGDYRLTGSSRRVHVEGRVRAKITQICVVTLDPFDTTVEEEVVVDFAEPNAFPAEPPADVHDYEPPDEIVGGRIDLGALTAEFLALGLDPHPRKPGVDFTFENEDRDRESPFAALGRLKKGE
jgi:hypothetical protein